MSQQAMQLWCVKRSKQGLKVAVHPGGQPRGQQPSTPNVNAAPNALGSEYVAYESGQLAHGPRNDRMVPLVCGSAENGGYCEGKEVHGASMIGVP